MNTPHISIVTPVYNTAAYAKELHARLVLAVTAITPEYEILFVNDASPDNAMEALLALKAEDPKVGIIDLAVNGGQHKAIFTGIEAARGDYVFVLDADLEEAPEWLARYYAAAQAQQADVVYGYQKSRKGGRVGKCTGALFFFVVNRLLGLPYRRNVVTATLMTRAFARHLLGFGEDRAIFSVTCYLCGHRAVALDVDKGHRSASSYHLPRRLAHFIDYMVAASDRPLLWPGMLGGLMTAGGLGWMICLLFSGYKADFYDKVLLATVVTIGGLILSSLGVIGVYLANALANARRRPRSIVKAFYAPDSSQ